MYVACCIVAFLFVAVNGQHEAHQSECLTARERELKVTAPGHFVPTCATDGTYAELQCHAGTQFCQCWTKEGDVVTQPSTKVKHCDCLIKKWDIERKFPPSGAPIGAFIPQCNDNGSHKTQQCHSSTGLCWCVNENGVKTRDLERGTNC